MKEPGMGSGPEQLGRESERDGGGEGWVWIICVGKRGSDSCFLQCEGHVFKDIGSQRGSKRISGHVVFVSENAVYRCTKPISFSFKVPANKRLTSCIRQIDTYVSPGFFKRTSYDFQIKRIGASLLPHPLCQRRIITRIRSLFLLTTLSCTRSGDAERELITYSLGITYFDFERGYFGRYTVTFLC